MGGQVLGPTAAGRAASRRARQRFEVCIAVALAVASALGLVPPARALYGPNAPAAASWRAIWIPGVASNPGTPGPTADPLTAGGAAAAGTPAAHVTVPTADRHVGRAAADRSLPRGRWAWPLAPRPGVIARFRAPSTAYGAGHRGVDLAATVGASVHAVATGRVSFAGVIGGKPTVAVTHTDGIRSTYEPVVAMVAVGDQVVVGQQLGTVAPAGSHCITTCVHLGAIRGTTYLDPLRLLGWWRVRLLPLEPPG
jgi:murein DD-endopeptidase MepM/ murein hydrolase activator NlpD